MSDNGSKEEVNNEIPKAQEILRVTLENSKDFKIQVFVGHIPTLTYCLKLLDVEISKMMIDQRIKQAQQVQQAQGIIIKPQHNIIDFIRGKKR